MIKYPHTCPKCGRKATDKKQLEKIFGLRKMHKDDRVRKPQSYCKRCRSQRSK